MGAIRHLRTAFSAAVQAARSAWQRQLRGTARDPRDLYRARLRLDTLTPAQIDSAYTQLSQGSYREIARFYELARATDPAIIASEMQLRGELASIEWDITPNGTSEEAVRAAEEINILHVGTGAHDVGMAAGIRAFLNGAHLCEVLWNDEGSARRAWDAVVHVPLHYLRRDLDTGEYGLSDTIDGWRGRPLAEFGMGKFLLFDPDPAIMDRSNAGVLRPVILDWYNRRQAAGWYPSRLERWGTPGLLGTMANETDKDEFLKFAETFGDNWALAVSSGSSITPVVAPLPTPSLFQEFEEMSRGNIAMAILGSPQALTIDRGAGSQASAAEFAGVRRAITHLIFTMVSEVYRTQLWAPYCAVRFGQANIAPRIVARRDDPALVASIADGMERLQKIGYPISGKYVSRTTRVPPPSEGETPLKPVEPPPGTPQPGEPSPVTPKVRQVWNGTRETSDGR